MYNSLEILIHTITTTYYNNGKRLATSTTRRKDNAMFISSCFRFVQFKYSLHRIMQDKWIDVVADV